jgi:uncharacterized membrane protein YgaE (UPF0421/DUF939 family)
MTEETPRAGLGERAQPLLEAAAKRSRASARTRADNLRSVARSILQATLAATVAWLVATEVVGHPRPFFAPVAAIITLGLAVGARGRRAVEVALGVTLGIAIGDLVISAIGVGWWQLAVVIAATMSAARLLGSGVMFAQQAAVSAALVATLQPPTQGVTFARSVDALVGAGIALIVNALVFPVHPGRMVRDAAAPVLEELSAVLEDVAAALEQRDGRLVQAALDRARDIEALERDFREAVDEGRDTARVAPPRRGTLGLVDAYADAFVQVDLAVRNVRVLARGARRAIDLDDNVPPEICAALRDLAAAVRALQEALDDPAGGEAVRPPALRAAAASAEVLERTGNLSATVMVGQIRSTAVDLLRSSGMTYEEAAEAVRTAAGTVPRAERRS